MADITSGLVAHWKLDETSGTSAADSSGNGHTGTYVNTPTLNETGAFGSSKAVTFASASTEYVEQSTLNWSTLSSACTVAAWVKMTDFAATYPIVGNAGAGTVGLFVNTSGQLDVRLGGTTVGTNRLIAGTAFSSGVWTHVCFTWDGTTLTLYTAGVVDGSDGSMTTTFTSGNIRLARSTSAYTDGTLDDVRIYSRALSAADVAELYAYTGERYNLYTELYPAKLPCGLFHN